MKENDGKIVNLFTQILIWKWSNIKTKENEENCVLCEQNNTTQKHKVNLFSSICG